MNSNSELYVQLTRPARKQESEDTVVETARKHDRVANQWREDRWGALEVNITDDPNFTPTETIEVSTCTESIDLSKPMKETEALDILGIITM